MSQNSIILPTTGTVSGLQMTQDINYALDTLNTLWSGASAPGSPEAGQLWHDTTANMLKIRDLANTTWIIIGALDETNKLFSANAVALTPQGRLTLASNTPIMTADAMAQTTIYYTPYIGNVLPVYNGTTFVNQSFSQMTLSLNASNHLSGKLYDVFAFLNSGTLTLAAGPAWTSNTARSAAITQLNGLWVNSASITLTNGSTSYSAIAASQATCLGTFYCTANGQTGAALQPGAASGGSNNIIGLFNAYNRQRVTARSMDNTSSWTYNSTTVRPANNSASNRISFVDGLAQLYVEAEYTVIIAPSSNAGLTGIGFNSIAAQKDITAAHNSTATSQYNSETAYLTSYPALGFNYVQALEYVNSGTVTFFGGFSGNNMGLFLTTEY